MKLGETERVGPNSHFFFRIRRDRARRRRRDPRARAVAALSSANARAQTPGRAAGPASGTEGALARQNETALLLAHGALLQRYSFVIVTSTHSSTAGPLGICHGN